MGPSPSLSPLRCCAVRQELEMPETMQSPEQEQQIEDALEIEPDSPGDGRKPKSVPCRYCQKRFRRLEHAQRHERTHTKEKPYKCSCGKTFGRRDLLVRHERLIHQIEPSKGISSAQSYLVESNQSTMSLQTASTDRQDPNSHSFVQTGTIPQSHESTIPQRASGYSLDLLSDAAHHLASDRYTNDFLSRTSISSLSRSLDVARQEPILSNQEILNSAPTQAEDAVMENAGASLTHADIHEDHNMFLDTSGINASFFSAFDPTIPVSFWSKPTDSVGQLDDSRLLAQETFNEPNSFSRFGSRRPSLQPEQHEQSFLDSTKTIEDNGVSKPWNISARDHRTIQSKLDNFSSILPHDFSLPLRRTLSRYVEGFISGFHEHMPCLHLPTLMPVDVAPELLLALTAIGAQYRFESKRGNLLWYAARAVALEQLRRRNEQQLVGDRSYSASYRPGTLGQTPQLMRDSENRTPVDTGTASGSHSNPTVDTPQARLETIQALFFLMAMGSWGSRDLLQEALTIRSQLAVLLRDEGLVGGATAQDLSWEAWIRIEGEKRTKLIVFAFFNLQCMAYDIPSPIMNSEINLSLPCSAKEWKADSRGTWRNLRQSMPTTDIYLRDALTRIFTRPGEIKIASPTSSLGNYVLIGAIIQQIYLTRKTSVWSAPSTIGNSLRANDIDDLSAALRAWQISWELTPESSLDPNSPNGPVAFNSTALLRLAYIRLHVDLGPHRHLEMRDSRRNAMALREFPALKRGPHLVRAVLQSAHALSVPVKMGIAFVARTQAFSWSIQHSLCNLECAFILSKWLETIAASANDLTAEERTVLHMVKHMLDETELAVSFEAEDGEETIDESVRIKQLGAAVVRLWAETFKGTHIFEIVQIIGQSLDIYADMLESANDLAGG